MFTPVHREWRWISILHFSLITRRAFWKFSPFPLLQQTVAVRTEIFYWNVFAYFTGTSCEEQEVPANETLVGNDTDVPRRRYDSSREVPLATAWEQEKR